MALELWDVPVHMVLAAGLLFSSLKLKSSLSIKLTQSNMPKNYIYTISPIWRDITSLYLRSPLFPFWSYVLYSKCTCSSSDSYLLLLWNSIIPAGIQKTSFIEKSVSHPGLQNIVIPEILNSNILSVPGNSLMLYWVTIFWACWGKDYLESSVILHNKSILMCLNLWAFSPLL